MHLLGYYLFIFFVVGSTSCMSLGQLTPSSVEDQCRLPFPSSPQKVLDVGDEAQDLMHPKPVLKAHPDILHSFSGLSMKEILTSMK